jgi:hypothetical protein
MELWKAQREYRLLATRLRKSAPAGDVLQAEEQVLVSLGTGEKLTTELGVLRAALRSTGSRMRKLRQSLGNSGLKHRLGRVLEPSALSEALAAQGFYALATLVSGVEHELQHFERRISEVQARITRQESLAEEALVRLRRLFLLHAL